MDMYVKVGERTVYYATVGHGPNALLLMPASVSTTWLQFKALIAAFPKDKFTIVSWNPLGIGRNKSAAIKYSTNWFEDLADYAYEFMKVLDIPKYSLLGWCGGGRSSFILAAKHPEVVVKLAVICTNSYITQPELDFLQNIPYRSSFVETILAYGDEAVSKNWLDFLKVMTNMYEANKGDICTGFLKDIKCPTLIIAGAKDRMVHEFHGEFLKEHIQGSRLYVYPDGTHRVPMTHAEDVNTRLEEFLLE